MTQIESLVLGLVQGLTEYLPISSSGHLTILSTLFGMEGEENLEFTVMVHVATVFSTLLILRKELVFIIKDLLARQSWSSYSGLNEGTKYAINIIVSMIPIGVVGLFFKDFVEDVFGSGLTIVGIMLLCTALLLAFSYYAKPRMRERISVLHAFVIGVAQSVAVMPGLSRSGSTIATGLLLGNKKEKLAKFSFLMVIPPILGEALLDTADLLKEGAASFHTPISTLAIGFLAAFVAGCVACKWMISIVNRGKLIYFALYCAVVGLVSVFIL